MSADLDAMTTLRRKFMATIVTAGALSVGALGATALEHSASAHGTEHEIEGTTSTTATRPTHFGGWKWRTSLVKPTGGWKWRT